MLTRLLAMAAVLISVGSAAAHAQWFYMKGDDNPFQGGQSHIAIAVSRGFSLGFRCTTGRLDLTLLYVTPERADKDGVTALKRVPFELRVIVDDDAPVKLFASVEVTPDGQFYRAESIDAGVDALLPRIGGAKRRVAVAAYVLEKIVWTSVFEAGGSRRATQALTEKCGLAPS